jgi:uncharacterized membrane protein
MARPDALVLEPVALALAVVLILIIGRLARNYFWQQNDSTLEPPALPISIAQQNFTPPSRSTKPLHPQTFQQVVLVEFPRRPTPLVYHWGQLPRNRGETGQRMVGYMSPPPINR